jgi:hypothetical protein
MVAIEAGLYAGPRAPEKIERLRDPAGEITSMTSNGRRRPRRPAIQVIAPAASPEQAAAIAAALERFLHDTAPAARRRRRAPGAWERAALAEGVCAEGPTAWGDPLPWGA